MLGFDRREGNNPAAGSQARKAPSAHNDPGTTRLAGGVDGADNVTVGLHFTCAVWAMLRRLLIISSEVREACDDAAPLCTGNYFRRPSPMGQDRLNKAIISPSGDKVQNKHHRPWPISGSWNAWARLSDTSARKGRMGAKNCRSVASSDSDQDATSRDEGPRVESDRELGNPMASGLDRAKWSRPPARLPRTRDI
ncbi:hypothetical protein BP5796_01863 [Coleophoma crateriformis]|uniref:Uncharacterized protein n=1 Tax=Coleophoma crateriformis TaxID=565419 RepID=A0A3D8T1U6_9HELO|nr:hypothetical protein BP5796_01863 [Coleophoma crateriformis]